MKMIKRLLSLLLVLLPAFSFAHEGHGGFTHDSPLHYLASPEHFYTFVLLAIGILAAITSVLLMKKSNKEG